MKKGYVLYYDAQHILVFCSMFASIKEIVWVPVPTITVYICKVFFFFVCLFFCFVLFLGGGLWGQVPCKLWKKKWQNQPILWQFQSLSPFQPPEKLFKPPPTTKSHPGHADQSISVHQIVSELVIVYVLGC